MSIILAALLLATSRCAASFRVDASSSARPELNLSSGQAIPFGSTPPLRLIYYIQRDDAFNDEDRDAVNRQIRLIREFYGRFGLEVITEDRVHEVRARVAGHEARSYGEIERHLDSLGLYAPGRTVVFADFDIGLGSVGRMALTVINDQRVDRRECPDGKGRAWWCGKPLSAHRGGCVHEVGHLLGLSHPEHGYENHLTVMGDHWRLGNDPGTGLLASEVEILKQRYMIRIGRAR